ncbi:hypothetical protein JRO89_XS08G0046900 [Xanthoceras sorbifolium]|uniref:V-SNARE coiled-coil homology domain-containing protein n=1 Tax=Xanthoceras sorbifolium TaxID=99658 RepID=A0ABQ8HNL9_9ROSI|nr:hypothetical protein JRO89_XS08G0046900 [Xanthoceras sorbifolium]
MQRETRRPAAASSDCKQIKKTGGGDKICEDRRPRETRRLAGGWLGKMDLCGMRGGRENLRERDSERKKSENAPKLKEQMQYCVDHPEEVSKLAKVKAQVSEVKGVMMENIEKVLDRGEKIELLVDKTENLLSQIHLASEIFE